jgi:hypothetical protein
MLLTSKTHFLVNGLITRLDYYWPGRRVKGVDAQDDHKGQRLRRDKLMRNMSLVDEAVVISNERELRDEIHIIPVKLN